MSDERTGEQPTGALPAERTVAAAPRVPAVRGAKGGVRTASRPPVGTILEQGGDVPSMDEGVKSLEFGEAFRALTEGQVVTGTVVHIDRDGVLVDVGTKSEGIIPPG